MNRESSKQSYRVALDAASADIAEIRAQIEQLSAVKERIEKAADALKSIMSLQDMAVEPVSQPVTADAPVENAEMDRPVSRPLFSSSYKPIPKFNEAPAAQGPEYRSVAALA